MNGHDKARLILDRRSLIEAKTHLLQQWFSEVLVVTNGARRYDYPGLIQVTDEQPGCGPLMGVYSGLKASSHEINFVTACDMPHINPQLAKLMINSAPQADVVISRLNGYRDPLPAVYHQRVMPFIKKCLDSQCRKMVSFFELVRVHEIPEQQLLALDPQLLSYININTPHDLDRAQKIFQPTIVTD